MVQYLEMLWVIFLPALLTTLPARNEQLTLVVWYGLMSKAKTI